MLELFTFVRSGGSLDAVVLKPLKLESAESAIKDLDISKADCFQRQDKQRILAIVEANFGSSMQFNLSCRQILSSKLAATTGTSSTPKKGATRLFDKRDVSVAV